MDELERVMDALILSADKSIATPANWPNNHEEAGMKVGVPGEGCSCSERGACGSRAGMPRLHGARLVRAHSCVPHTVALDSTASVHALILCYQCLISTPLRRCRSPLHRAGCSCSPPSPSEAPPAARCSSLVDVDVGGAAPATQGSQARTQGSQASSHRCANLRRPASSCTIPTPREDADKHFPDHKVCDVPSKIEYLRLTPVEGLTKEESKAEA